MAKKKDSRVTGRFKVPRCYKKAYGIVVEMEREALRCVTEFVRSDRLKKPEKPEKL